VSELAMDLLGDKPARNAYSSRLLAAEPLLLQQREMLIDDLRHLTVEQVRGGSSADE
jgi:hypothetical protein